MPRLAADSTEATCLRRQSRLAESVASAEVAYLLVTNPKDVGYLTGFHGGDSYLVLPARGRAGKAVLISDFRYKEELEPVKEAGIADVFIRSKSMIEAVAEVLGSLDGGKGSNGTMHRIGIQAEHMTIAIKAAVGKKIGAKRLTGTSGLVSALRIIKDEHEIALIRKAAKIQEAALEAILPSLKPGQTEQEIAAALEAEMKSRGSSEPGFQSIVAAGANGSLPHYRPGTKKTAAGKPLLIDWGAVCEGYHSDMTRTFTFGKWLPKMKEIFQIVFDAQNAAAAALAPGKTTKEIDAIARTHIAKAGYNEFFGHGLGHGIGLDGHEEPRLTNMLAGVALAPGMVVTIEPGIYLPGIGGVRIEDDYVITETGARNLCTLKKDLDSGTL